MNFDSVSSDIIMVSVNRIWCLLLNVHWWHNGGDTNVASFVAVGCSAPTQCQRSWFSLFTQGLRYYKIDSIKCLTGWWVWFSSFSAGPLDTTENKPSYLLELNNIIIHVLLLSAIPAAQAWNMDNCIITQMSAYS